jgi:hypothetical protein
MKRKLNLRNRLLVSEGISKRKRVRNAVIRESAQQTILERIEIKGLK